MQKNEPFDQAAICKDDRFEFPRAQIHACAPSTRAPYVDWARSGWYPLVAHRTDNHGAGAFGRLKSAREFHFCDDLCIRAVILVGVHGEWVSIRSRWRDSAAQALLQNAILPASPLPTRTANSSTSPREEICIPQCLSAKCAVAWSRNAQGMSSSLLRRSRMSRQFIRLQFQRRPDRLARHALSSLVDFRPNAADSDVRGCRCASSE